MLKAVSHAENAEFADVAGFGDPALQLALTTDAHLLSLIS
jgi:hypothetical protein